ncbi:response regulator transcription factor [Rubritalea spongiae]|uniref:Response regulator transcription factor n=1 Tax=Rubritalea spongiae TaxID=430797 RepID=A0ABW5E3S7_9BACT
MKLLVVDDSLMMREAIANAYQGSIFTEFETASNGLEAVQAFKCFQPEVVTLDITMPHMDGLAAMSEMLEMDSSASILIVSALADSHTAIQALKRGAHQFICKPFDTSDLKEALDDLIQDRKPQEQAASVVSERLKLKNTIAHSRVSLVEKPAKSALPRPSAHQYPSGFVSPPQFGKKFKHETDSTRKIKPFSSTYVQMHKLNH